MKYSKYISENFLNLKNKIMKKNRPGQPIPRSLFDAMKEEYRKNRLELINTTLGINDATKTWYSKKTIDALFKAAGATPANEDQFGLEIHYGVVPQDRQGVDIPDDYVGLHNVILIATKESGEITTLDGDDGKEPYNAGTLCPPNC